MEKVTFKNESIDFLGRFKYLLKNHGSYMGILYAVSCFVLFTQIIYLYNEKKSLENEVASLHIQRADLVFHVNKIKDDFLELDGLYGEIFALSHSFNSEVNEYNYRVYHQLGIDSSLPEEFKSENINLETSINLGDVSSIFRAENPSKSIYDKGKVIFAKMNELKLSLITKDHLLDNIPIATPVLGNLTSGYGYRYSPFSPREISYHNGIDIMADAGTKIFAPANGVVAFAGRIRGYGQSLIINHSNGIQTQFAHLNEYFVKSGDLVSKGALIGLVGNTGRSTGPHLHYEIRVNGELKDPELFTLGRYNIYEKPEETDISLLKTTSPAMGGEDSLLDFKAAH